MRRIACVLVGSLAGVGCAGTFAQHYRLYDGPELAKDQIAIVKSRKEPSLWIEMINGEAAPKSGWDDTFAYELRPGTYVLDFTSAKYQWGGMRSVKLEAQAGRVYRVGDVPGGVGVSDVTGREPAATSRGKARIVRVPMDPSPMSMLSADKADLALMAIVSVNGKSPAGAKEAPGSTRGVIRESVVALEPGRQQLVLSGHRTVIKSLELTQDRRGRLVDAKADSSLEQVQARISFEAQPGGRYRLKCNSDAQCEVSDQLQQNKVVSELVGE